MKNAIETFNSRTQEIALSNKRSWDLMNWVKNHKLPATEPSNLMVFYTMN